MLDQETGTQIDRDGLVLWLPLNGNANDYSGVGNHGTSYNSPVYEDGRLTKALTFNGTTQYTLFGRNSLPTGSAQRAMSIRVRFNSTLGTGTKVFFTYGNNNTRDRCSFITYYDGTYRYLLCDHNNCNEGFLWTADTNWHTFQMTLPAGKTRTDEIIVMYDGIVVYDGSGGSYNPGTLNTTVATGWTPAVATLAGATNESNYRPAVTLCDARIYNKAKTTDQLAAIARGEA